MTSNRIVQGSARELNINRVYRLKSPVRMAYISTWTESKVVYLMRESLSLQNQKSYYCASKSLAGNKIILSQSETVVGETNFGRQWPRFSTCKVAITALIAFSLVLRHDRLQLVDVGASEVCHLFLVLQKDEGWHRGHLVLLRNVFALVDVNLEEDDVVHGLVHLLQVGRDHLAGAAPGGEEVDHHQLAASVRQLSFKVFLVFNSVNHLELSCRSESSNKSL